MMNINSSTTPANTPFPTNPSAAEAMAMFPGLTEAEAVKRAPELAGSVNFRPSYITDADAATIKSATGAEFNSRGRLLNRGQLDDAAATAAANMYSTISSDRGLGALRGPVTAGYLNSRVGVTGTSATVDPTFLARAIAQVSKNDINGDAGNAASQFDLRL